MRVFFNPKLTFHPLYTSSPKSTPSEDPTHDMFCPNDTSSSKDCLEVVAYV